MNLQKAIYNKILEPKYLRIYNLIEELSNTRIERFKKEYKEDIVTSISDIVVIKERYRIPFNDDLVLLEKYKI